jgi:hypothetical protein
MRDVTMLATGLSLPRTIYAPLPPHAARLSHPAAIPLRLKNGGWAGLGIAGRVELLIRDKGELTPGVRMPGNVGDFPPKRLYRCLQCLAFSCGTYAGSQPNTERSVREGSVAK